MPAAPLNADLMKSAAVQFPVDDSVPLQLNIFSKDSRHYDIVSEVSILDIESEYLAAHAFVQMLQIARSANCRKEMSHTTCTR